jgi:hypothetical protein
VEADARQLAARQPFTSSTDEIREHCIQPIAELDDPRHRFAVSPTAHCGNLDGGDGFDELASRDGVGASLIRAGGSPRSFGEIEASPFRSAFGFIAKLHVGDASIEHRSKELERNAIGYQPVMWK